MIEISLGKLVLLALIALIVLGPEKLPGAARTAGALLRRVRSGWDNVRAEVERELEIEEIRRTARAAAAQAEAAQNEVKEGVRQMHEPLSRTAEEIATLVKPDAGEPAKPIEPAADDAASSDAALIDDAPIDAAPIDDRQAELPLGESSPSPGTSPHDHA